MLIRINPVNLSSETAIWSLNLLTAFSITIALSGLLFLLKVNRETWLSPHNSIRLILDPSLESQF